ncbi:unnamed protein product, partial [marine sediment metagenome]
MFYKPVSWYIGHAAGVQTASSLDCSDYLAKEGYDSDDENDEYTPIFSLNTSDDGWESKCQYQLDKHVLEVAIVKQTEQSFGTQRTCKIIRIWGPDQPTVKRFVEHAARTYRDHLKEKAKSYYKYHEYCQDNDQWVPHSITTTKTFENLFLDTNLSQGVR